MRHALLALLSVAACGGGGDSKPVPFTHADPAFTFDAPGGMAAQPERDQLGTARAIDFQGKSAALSVSVSWEPAYATAEAERAEHKSILAATDERTKITGEGPLPGGDGVWLETDYLGGTVEAWLRVGDVMVECTGSAGGRRSGAAPVLAACKTLRPTP